MTLKRITAPTRYPVSLPEFKDYAAFDSNADDARLEETLAAAIDSFDGDGGELNRAILTQTWDYQLDCFPSWGIKIPLPPLQSVTSITYLDEAGATQTLATSLYSVDIKSEPGRVSPAVGESWPTTYRQLGAVTIRFVAGWTHPGAVPAPIKLGIKALATWLREQAVPVNIGNIVNVLPMHINQQLERYRIRYL